MYVYVIEEGAAIGSQKGHIVNIFTNKEAARHAFAAMREAVDVSWNEIKDGVSKYDHEPGVLAGFFYGPKGGNTCAHGYRLQRIWAFDK